MLGDRWTILIIRDMLLGARHFNEMARGLPGISRSLLSERLRQLEESGLVERRVGGERFTEYHLTKAGQDLERLMETLIEWGTKWGFHDPTPDELDPKLLLWWVQGRINLNRIPQGRTVIQFDFRGGDKGSYWLVLEPKRCLRLSQASGVRYRCAGDRRYLCLLQGVDGEHALCGGHSQGLD